jgi:ElaB/YqjD/DUF883 family membrane-anchored ribosome-binding protein
MAAIVNPLRKPMKNIVGKGRELSSPLDLEEVRMAARDAMKRTRRAAEDAVDDVARVIKRYPLRAAGIALGTGALIGICLLRAATKK